MIFYIGLSLVSNNGACDTDNVSAYVGKPAQNSKNIPNKISIPGSKTANQKLTSAEARRLLSILTDRELTENDIAKDKNGRPYFKTMPGELTVSDIDFNISHSGSLAAVSVVRGKSSTAPSPGTTNSLLPMRTGCDVELVKRRKYSQKIAQDYFSPAELEYVSNNGNFDEARFFHIWTLKECYIKLRGLTVFDLKKIPSFIGSPAVGNWEQACANDDQSGHFCFCENTEQPLTFFLYELTGAEERYILAVAAEGADLKPTIKWFSQSALACKTITEIRNSYDCKTKSRITS